MDQDHALGSRTIGGVSPRVYLVYAGGSKNRACDKDFPTIQRFRWDNREKINVHGTATLPFR